MSTPNPASVLDIEIDDEALEIARKAIEDELIEWRDNTRFMVCGNGFTIRNRDGSDSGIIRFRTDVGLRIGLRAYLRALASRPPTEGNASDDATGQGIGGGEPAAVTRTGADDREVGAVASEAAPAAEEGGVGEPAADAPLCAPPLCNRPSGHDGMHLGGDT